MSQKKRAFAANLPVLSSPRKIIRKKEGAFAPPLLFAVFSDRGRHRVGGNAEMLIKPGRRTGSAESVHADDFALAAEILLPAEFGGSFDHDPRRTAENPVAVFFILTVKQLGTGHRNHSNFNSLFPQFFLRFDGNRDFRPGGNDRRLPATSEIT